MNLEIKNKDSLIRILKAISWLDYRRWKTEDNYNFIHFSKDDLGNCEKILTHWICYITDRRMPFENIWDRGGYVFSELVSEYSKNTSSPKELLDKYYKEKEYDDKKGKKRFEFKSLVDSRYTFASRYITDDYQNILQTLEVLNNQKYRRNIIVYIIDIMQKFKSEGDLLIRVSCALHLLTYQLDRKKSHHEATIEILNDDSEFDKKLKRFKGTSTNGEKRLWCCVRDYKKGLYHRIFNEAIREASVKNAEELINLWNKLPMNQIELPGDIWNNSPIFRDNLFPDVLDLERIPKQWGMPQIVRKLYDQLKDDGEVYDFYPEQFDITFDFVPRMCSKKLCNVCLFGKNGVKSICIPTTDKYCPVALLSCGYMAKCRDQEENCIIKEEISKGICKGR